MQLRQGKIIQKPKMQELSSLFMTHRLSVMHALVKFHEYIPYSLGVMGVHNLEPQNAWLVDVKRDLHYKRSKGIFVRENLKNKHRY